ncbi:MAG: hypothetical protein U5M50_11175 [Sphingobium sp.]|nr:hypothetical protein [Sphingobium sp.]
MRSLNARPVRFLLLILSAWVIGRASGHWLWLPETAMEEARETFSSPALAAEETPLHRPAVSRAVVAAASPRDWASASAWHTRPAAPPLTASNRNGTRVEAVAPPPRAEPPERSVAAPERMTLAPVFAMQTGSRWTVDGWLFLRDGHGDALSQGSTLGGSQAGLRIARALSETSAIYARISGAIDRPRQPELALGASWRPLAAMGWSLNAERRVALDRDGRDGFAFFAAGGIGAQPIASDWQLDGYAQAGVVGLKRRDGFVDGRLSITRAVDRGQPDRLRFGVTMSGAAQPQVERLDIGPRIEWRPAAMPLSAELEWRQRIAGNAAPGSGPALTIGTHF